MVGRHLLFMALITAIWGLAPIVMKVAFEQIPPLAFTSARFFLVAIVLAPFLRWHTGKMWAIAAIGATVGWLEFGLFFTGLHMAGDVAPMAVAVQLSVPFATILSIFFLGEVVHWRRWTGISLSFAGVMLFAFDPQVLGYAFGIGLAIAAAVSHSFAMIFMKRLEDVGVFELQAWLATMSAPMLAFASIVLETGQLTSFGSANFDAYAIMIYGAFLSSLVAHAGFYWMVQKYEVTVLAPFTLLAPVFTILLSYLVLNDQLTTRMIIGSLITLAGVTIVTLRGDELAETEPLP
jgi:O-acetylserine/cysteine efflux transporter